jgi:proton glutamate symport protein
MKNSFLFKVVAGMLLGALAGYLTGSSTELFGVPFVRYYDLIGKLFLNALTLVVVPLVASSIITGTARVGADKSFASLGGKTFGYFFVTGVCAVSIGFIFYYLIQPGVSADQKSVLTATVSSTVEQIQSQAAGGTFERIEAILLRLVPSNIFAVASQGQMLGLIFFSVIFGVLSTRIETDLSQLVIKLANALFQIMMKMTHVVMLAMPIGVFGLMAKVVSTTGLEAVKPVAIFFVTVIAGLLVYTFIVLPLLLKILVGANPIAHFKAVAPALFTAFTTSSSAATLPITMECMEKRANIPNRFCSFILPLGTTVNLTGSALYATIAVMFIAQAYGIDFNAGNIVTIAIMCLFIAMGMVAGIPSGTFVTIVVILQTIGLPAEGIILILPVERILDMFRTSVNVFSSTCVTVLVAKSKHLGVV